MDKVDLKQEQMGNVNRDGTYMKKEMLEIKNTDRNEDL